MNNLFFEGGPLFMSILTILGIMMLAWMIFQYAAFSSGKQADIKKTLQMLKWGRSIGLFALITGILAQMIGLYQAFFAIERAGDISPALVVGGLKISMISTIYGIIIYLLSLFFWFVFSFLVSRK